MAEAACEGRESGMGGEYIVAPHFMCFKTYFFVCTQTKKYVALQHVTGSARRRRGRGKR